MSFFSAYFDSFCCCAFLEAKPDVIKGQNLFSVYQSATDASKFASDFSIYKRKKLKKAAQIILYSKVF
jgi:hypothetical protein